MVIVPGSNKQSVVHLAADPGGAQVWPQLNHITFIKIDQEIISMVILPLLHSSQRSVVCY